LAFRVNGFPKEEGLVLGVGGIVEGLGDWFRVEGLQWQLELAK
jgi:hypothetical protein